MGKEGMLLMEIVREGRRGRKVRFWRIYSNHPTSSGTTTIPGKGGKKKEGGGEGAQQQQLSPDQQEKLRQAMEMLSMQNQVKNHVTLGNRLFKYLILSLLL